MQKKHRTDHWNREFRDKRLAKKIPIILGRKSGFRSYAGIIPNTVRNRGAASQGMAGGSPPVLLPSPGRAGGSPPPGPKPPPPGPKPPPLCERPV